MYNNTCDRNDDPLIDFEEFDIREKQCAVISHQNTPQMTWSFCNERHPFICEKQLGKIISNHTIRSKVFKCNDITHMYFWRCDPLLTCLDKNESFNSKKHG